MTTAMRPVSPAIFVGQPFGEFFPGGAAVGGLVDRGVRSAAIESVRSAAPLIGSGVKGVRALGVHGDVAHAGVVVDLENLRPSLAAVGRFVNATLGIRSPQMSERRNVNDVRISGMYDNSPDVARRFEPDHLLPGLPGVERFVRAIAPGGALPVVGLARPDPDNGGVRGCDCGVANGREGLPIR